MWAEHTRSATKRGAKLTMENEDLAKMVRSILREEIAAAFEMNLKPINTALKNLQGKVATCLGKVSELETAANDTAAELAERKLDCETFQAEIKKLKKKCDDLENHSRKFNLRIIGLPNGIEAGKPTQFVTKLLYELFGEGELGLQPLVNVAHRIGPLEKNDTGQEKSRCMIVRVHSSEVRQTIIRLASQRGKQGIYYQEKRLSFYPDLTAEQREQRAVFDDVRAALRKTKLRYGVVYPGKLIITFNKITHTFTKASEAMDFFKTTIEPSLLSEQDDKEEELG